MSVKVIASAWRGAFAPESGRVTRSASTLLLFSLFLGIVAGGGLGVFSSALSGVTSITDYAKENFLSHTFLSALINASRFFVIGALFSTSYLGIALIPSLVFVRGFILGHAISAVFAAFSFTGLVCVSLAQGIPALITLPCFLIACCDSFESSKSLFLQRFHAMPPIRTLHLFWHTVLIFAAVAFDFFYSFYLLPILLAKLI